MKKLIFTLAFCLLLPAALQAQSGTKLSPYEQHRYGGSLWDVPREPYQSQFQNDRFKAKVYNLPESTVRERFQSRMEWENQQQGISERSEQGYLPQKSVEP